jgi:N-methylhydantoinase A
VGIDVGGTTTDIGQCLNGKVAEVQRGHVEGISVSFPLCEIMSAGAGGSSIIKVVNGRVVIGPESVGAVPGPAAFGRGGKEATITDASLLSGLFDPKSYFGGGMSLDLDRAATAVQVRIAEPLGVDLDEALLKMEHAYEDKIAVELHRFTKISKDTVMLAFGGAGPLNACGVAEKAGIDKVAVPKLAAVFSAFGIGSCDISQRYAVALNDRGDKALSEALEALKVKASRDMFAEGFGAGEYEVEAWLVGENSDGSESTHAISGTPTLPAELTKAVAVELQLRAVKSLRTSAADTARFVAGGAAKADGTRKVLIRDKGRVDVPVYKLSQLKAGDQAAGPAILEEDYFTCRVLDGWSFVISDAGDIMLNRKG